MPPNSKYEKSISHNILKEVVGDCVNLGVTLELKAVSRLEFKEMKYSGEFDEESSPPKLTVATNRPLQEWIPVLVHEYCHLMQWKEGLFRELDPEHKLDRWLTGEDCLTREEAEKIVREYQECELDCEKRTWNLLTLFGWPFDRKNYIREANAYVMMYSLALEKRQWTQKVIGKHSTPKSVAATPTKWLDEISEVHFMSRAFREAAEKELFK